MDFNGIKPEMTLKFVIVGNIASGKTNILNRFVDGKFVKDSMPTMNIDFSYKNIKIKDHIYRLQIWDTEGQEQFKSISRGYYKNTVCAIIVYDITNKDTFTKVGEFIEEAKCHGPKTISLILVGNKKDLENKRQISFEEGEDLANRNNMLFFEASALTGENIDKIFYDTMESIIRKIEYNYYKNEDECGIIFNKIIKVDIDLKLKEMKDLKLKEMKDLIHKEREKDKKEREKDKKDEKYKIKAKEKKKVFEQEKQKYNTKREKDFLKVTKKSHEKILEQMNNCIYLIRIDNEKNLFCFFCYIKFKKKDLPVMITTSEILKEKYLINYNSTIVQLNNKDITINLGDKIY